MVRQTNWNKKKTKSQIDSSIYDETEYYPKWNERREKKYKNERTNEWTNEQARNFLSPSLSFLSLCDSLRIICRECLKREFICFIFFLQRNKMSFEFCKKKILENTHTHIFNSDCLHFKYYSWILQMKMMKFQSYDDDDEHNRIT